MATSGLIPVFLFLLVLTISSCIAECDINYSKTVNSTSGSVSQIGLLKTPTQAINSSSPRQQILETLFTYACIEQTTFSKHDKIKIHWSANLPTSGYLTIRIMQGSRIYGELQAYVEPETTVDMGHAYVYPYGKLQIVMMSTPDEYYIDNLRTTRKLEIEVFPQDELPVLIVNHC